MLKRMRPHFLLVALLFAVPAQAQRAPDAAPLPRHQLAVPADSTRSTTQSGAEPNEAELVSHRHYREKDGHEVHSPARSTHNQVPAAMAHTASVSTGEGRARIIVVSRHGCDNPGRIAVRELSPDEAKALFTRPLFCEDYDDWEPWGLHPNTTALSAGVVDKDGVSARLLVELLYTYSPRTKITSYRFSVFRRNTWGNEPAYQLHVSQHPKRLKNAHAEPHEHVGTERKIGDASWAKWGYDEVLSQFCKRTNITFLPNPPAPMDFSLKG
jgi:hypothetical protein